MKQNTARWTGAGLSFLVMYWAMTLRVNASAGTVTLPKGMEKALSALYKEYYIFINGFIAFGLLTGVLAFIILFIKLAANSDIPMMRAFVLREMLVVGVSTALLGGFPLMIVLYYEMFQ